MVTRVHVVDVLVVVAFPTDPHAALVTVHFDVVGLHAYFTRIDIVGNDKLVL